MKEHACARKKMKILHFANVILTKHSLYQKASNVNIDFELRPSKIEHNMNRIFFLWTLFKLKESSPDDLINQVRMLVSVEDVSLVSVKCMLKFARTFLIKEEYSEVLLLKYFLFWEFMNGNDWHKSYTEVIQLHLTCTEAVVRRCSVKNVLFRGGSRDF